MHNYVHVHVIINYNYVHVHTYMYSTTGTVYTYICTYICYIHVCICNVPTYIYTCVHIYMYMQVRSGCDFLCRVCQDEYQLYFHFFNTDCSELRLASAECIPYMCIHVHIVVYCSIHTYVLYMYVRINYLYTLPC